MFLKPALAFTAITMYTVAASAPAPVAIRRFFEVNEHLYRGGQPTASALKSLAKLGVRSVIDLRGPGRRSAIEEKQVESFGMKYYSIPMRSLSAPEDRQVNTALALIADPNNWPVFLHCEHGKDRTGTVIASYRIQHDRWPNERALAEAEDHGLSWAERGMREFILHYQPLAPARQGQ